VPGEVRVGSIDQQRFVSRPAFTGCAKPFARVDVLILAESRPQGTDQCSIPGRLADFGQSQWGEGDESADDERPDHNHPGALADLHRSSLWTFPPGRTSGPTLSISDSHIAIHDPLDQFSQYKPKAFRSPGNNGLGRTQAMAMINPSGPRIGTHNVRDSGDTACSSLVGFGVRHPTCP
jgi:hypothetical protein